MPGPSYYRIKPKKIQFAMRLVGVTFADIAKILKINTPHACLIIGGRCRISRPVFLKIKKLINDEVMGRPLSTVELAERIK